MISCDSCGIAILGGEIVDHGFTFCQRCYDRIGKGDP